MEIKQVWQIIKRRWGLIFIPVIIVGLSLVPDLMNQQVAATTGGFASTIRYSAAQMLNLPERDGDYQDVWLASELTVNAFTDWVRSSSFRSEIAEIVKESDLDVNLLGIAADNARSIGVIYLSYPEAEGLERLTEASIVALSSQNKKYFPQLGGEDAQVTLLDEINIVANPAPLGNRFGLLIKLGLALLSGILIAFIFEYLDSSIHNRYELEKEGFEVLGSIPK
ncbi:hypothetical protein MASR2M15_11900 [Anaerolineales bacterium]